ncbi:hypothetical protein JQ604_30610 [Bradyrhizobium jicamae]|uniref:hypothetical protein n=1 Tax=Bradyrhizobium jicamae TaxID=280332 RepID=UPI001BAA2B28|nr:hypothetical protein [Bradyrhizobium jicamae]MBR0756552.1 hypothetical protein [Bradyrhizobium jicamae]
MPALKSLIAIAAIASVATASVAQAGSRSSRKAVKPAPIVLNENVLNSNAAYVPKTPAWSYQGTRGLSSPAGRS